jgi:hypothetical protein
MMEPLHVEDFARRLILSLRRSGRVEIEPDFFQDLIEELAERISFGDALFPDEISAEVSDALMSSDYVVELFADDGEIFRIVSRLLQVSIQ